MKSPLTMKSFIFYNGMRLIKHSHIHLLIFVVFACHLIFFTSQVAATVKTDGSVGPAQILLGPDYIINNDLGTTVGNNLFHSFQSFSIDQTESATFNGPHTIENVISRITGGEVSNIDGLLRSEIGTTAFYFINPAGIVFGKNARVDVPGDFNASTAAELRFADGTAYNTLSDSISTLSMSAPESLGFLAPHSASISFKGSQLEFSPESALSLSAGDINILDNDGQKAQILMQGASARICAFGQQTGAVSITSGSPVEAEGSLVMNNAEITLSDNDSKLVINAG